MAKLEIIPENAGKQMELLYKKFFRQLYLYALTIVNDANEANDIVNDSFTTIWHQWNKKKEISGTSSTFLYTIVRNRCLDYIRRSQARDRYIHAVKSSCEFESEADVQEFESLVQRIYEAIQKLPEPERTILHYTYYEGMTYQETANKLGISINMVHKKMSKTFRLLRSMLKKI